MQKWSLRIHADVISERRGVLPSILGTREIEIVLNIVLLCGVFLFVVVVFVFFPDCFFPFVLLCLGRIIYIISLR